MQDTALATFNKTWLHQLFMNLHFRFFLQAPLLDPLDSPLTGYHLQYLVYNDTSTIELPALNTSYTLDCVPSDVVYKITVSALNEVGRSRNNPSVQLGETCIYICCMSMINTMWASIFRNLIHCKNRLVVLTARWLAWLPTLELEVNYYKTTSFFVVSSPFLILKW